MRRQRLVCGGYNPLCCGKGEGSVACFPLGDRTVTFFVFFAASARARFIPSDLWCLAILQETTVEQIPNHLRATCNRDCERGWAVHIGIAAEVHAAIDLESPHGQLRIVLTLCAFVSESALAQISRDVRLSRESICAKTRFALVGEHDAMEE